MPEEKLYFSNRILFLWIGALIAVSISFFLIQFKIKPSGDFPVALHYNILVGIDSFGKAWSLYIIPAAGLFIIGINFVLYRFLKRQDPFLSFLAAFISVSASLILLLATMFLLSVNS